MLTSATPIFKSQRSFVCAVFLLALFFGCGNRASASWDYGNGRHGSFVLTTNATIEQLYQTVRLTNDPAQYNPTDSNAVPNFQNFTIRNGATLTANAWNGSSGGRITCNIQTNLLIELGGVMSVNGLGYRGGTSQQQGESYAGVQSLSTSANYGGGGGCAGDGGGGGYGTMGSTTCGSGGNTYGSASLDTVYLGSGGGGGYGYTGGNGGGAIVVSSRFIQIDGVLKADGNTAVSYVQYGGGSGSGGTILMHCVSANLGHGNVSAIGGVAGQYGHGGAGGAGRTAIAYTGGSYSGTIIPSPYIPPYVVTITNQPFATTNVLGSNCHFNVGISSGFTNSFQWFFNSAPIPSATNEILSLTNLTLASQGSYSVVISNAVMVVTSSNAYLTVLDIRDFDGDGIPNWWENQYGLNPNNPGDASGYPPGEQLTWLQKYLYGLNSTATDFDGDGVNDYNELFVHGTNPLKSDTDGDGIPDSWEIQYGLNPLINDTNDDADFDRLSNLQEYQYDLTHTNQFNPRNGYSAGFGLSDYEVFTGGQMTNNFYYDRNNRLLGMESSRGVSFAYVYDGNDNLIRQAQMSRAGETNGLPVLWRFLNGLTNNTSSFADADGDGWSDFQEWNGGSNPTNSQSRPNSLADTSLNIASLTLPFTPSNFVVGVGQLDGAGAEEIVIGADGNPGTTTNRILILTQNSAGWTTNVVEVGSFGVTSIAIGQVTNRSSSAIYLGLRKSSGLGQILELANVDGLWQTNLLARSTNEAAYVLGVRPMNDVLVSVATTNCPDGSLSRLTYQNGLWLLNLMDSSTSHRGLNTIANPKERPIYIYTETGASLPTNAVFNAAFGKWYFSTPSRMTWTNAQAYARQFSGNLVTVTNPAMNNWIYTQFQTVDSNGQFWIGASRDTCCSPAATCQWKWSSGVPFSFYNWNNTEPTCSDGNERYTEMTPGGGWNDLPNSSLLFGVIEYDPAANRRTINSSWALRLLDAGGISVATGTALLTNAVYRPESSAWYMTTPDAMTWDNAEAFARTYQGHLASISDASENEFVRTTFTPVAGGVGMWIGLNDIATENSFVWSSRDTFPYRNWYGGEPGGGVSENGVEMYVTTSTPGAWNDLRTDMSRIGVIKVAGDGIRTPTLVPEPTLSRAYNWRSGSLASGFPRGAMNQNELSLFYTFADDKNSNNITDGGDEFVVSESRFRGTNSTALTLFRLTLRNSTLVPSYGLASVNFLNQSNDIFFAAEPDGQVYSWIATNANGPLQRQLFSTQLPGKAWHAMAGVKTLEPGEGLVGLRVDATNQNKCDVIFWAPHYQLPTTATVPQTAPLTRILPSPNAGKGVASVKIRIWDAEGNSSAPYLQFLHPVSSNWVDAAIAQLDGTNFVSGRKVMTLPTGADHEFLWNAFADLGANFTNTIQLRARAMDVTLIGEWSEAMPYLVEITNDSDHDGLPDWWEQAWALNPLSAAGNNGASGDPDADGFSNWAEYVADTNPQESASYLRISGLRTTSTNLVVDWMAGLQSRQILSRRFDLNATNWLPVFTNEVGGAGRSFTNPIGTNRSLFFRIEATRP